MSKKCKKCNNKTKEGRCTLTELYENDCKDHGYNSYDHSTKDLCVYRSPNGFDMESGKFSYSCSSPELPVSFCISGECRFIKIK